MLRCPREALRQRREQKAAATAAVSAASDDSLQAESPSAESPAADSPFSKPQLSMRESVSSIDDSQDGEVDVGQESTSECIVFRSQNGLYSQDGACSGAEWLSFQYQHGLHSKLKKACIQGQNGLYSKDQHGLY